MRCWCNERREEENEERISCMRTSREREREYARARESGLYLLKNSRDGESKKPRQRRISSPKERETETEKPTETCILSLFFGIAFRAFQALWVVRFAFVFLCRENFCVFQRKDFFYSSLTTNNKRFNTNAKNTRAFASSVQRFALHRLFVNVFVRALLANR